MNEKKVTREKLTANRQQEIIRACEELYETLDYEEINIKEIAKSTSICRSNIYNYYETKEEIFLDIPLQGILPVDGGHGPADGGGRPAQPGELLPDCHRHGPAPPQLLRLLSAHHTTIEKNCSLEKITAFKRSLEPFQDGMRRRLSQYFPQAAQEKKEHFLLVLLSLAQGITP